MNIEVANLKNEVSTTAVYDLLNAASTLNYAAYKTYKQYQTQALSQLKCEEVHDSTSGNLKHPQEYFWINIQGALVMSAFQIYHNALVKLCCMTDS